MATLRISLQVELDGVKVDQLCRTRRLEVDEAQSFNIERATGGGASALPLGELTTLQALVLTSDQAVSIQLGATAEADITLAANGLVIAFDVSQTASNAKVTNASGSTAVLKGIGGGT